MSELNSESALREQMVLLGKSLFDRGYVHGSSGNLSVRVDDGFLVTPTNSSLGFLDPARISKLDGAGQHLSGDKPSKETFLHQGIYSARGQARAVAHSHSFHSVALSCLDHKQDESVLPPVTAYSIMKLGHLRLLPYYPPGDATLAAAVEEAANAHRSLLLAHHGPVVAGRSIEDAVWSLEELEETARLVFLLEGKPHGLLTLEQVQALEAVFPD